MSMAARPIATGTISFGLVAIPVQMFSSTDSGSKIQFNSIHESCGSRVRQRLYCPTHDALVPREELVKGYEFAKDQYVLFEPDELKAMELSATHSIDIKEFVPVSAVDPIYFEKAYYLGPATGGRQAVCSPDRGDEEDRKGCSCKVCSSWQGLPRTSPTLRGRAHHAAIEI